MMIKIPLHSLILILDEMNDDEQAFISSNFDNIIDLNTVKTSIYSNNYNEMYEDDLLHHISSIIDFRLKIGQRVIVSATNLKRRDRSRFVKIGQKFHVPIFYFITKNFHQNTFYSDTKNKIIDGENSATCVDLTDQNFKNKFFIVKKFNRFDLKDDLSQRGFGQFCVIGDVHGMYNDLKQITDESLKRGQLIIQLGDLIDYGPDVVACVELMYKLVMNGSALFIIGNHERKLFKYFKQKAQNNLRIEIKGGLTNTIAQLSKLNISQYQNFENKFNALIMNSGHHAIIGNKLFVHASATPSMWNNFDLKLTGNDEKRAIFGKISSELIDNFYPRIYDWIDEIPNNHTVYIGHDIKDNKISIKQGIQGGTLVFTDTGSGKGGILSSVVGDI